ncbi:MAG: hypothetical protein RMJ87_10430 [Cytophagales bacterium]|nr:hypothetical protein [Bernardetiaceae bacterium]MDW8205436.1 hypothetical protein [Cytophagales bacterium]
MRYLLLAYCVLAVCFATLAQKKIKERKAFQKEPDGIASRLILHEQYDPQGNLLYAYQPDLHCEMTYSYDEQNRLVQSYQMCGENVWNGTLVYSYPAPNVVVVQSREMVAGSTYLRRDTLDAARKLIASWSYWTMPNQTADSIITYTRYTYSPKGLLLRTQTRTIVYDRRYPQQPDSQTDEVEEFEYNRYDSLTTRYVYAANAPQQKRMTYQAQFDSLSGRKVESFEQPSADGAITRREYIYDEVGRLSHFKSWYLPSDEAAWMMSHEILYRYPNERERIEIWRTYYQNAFDVEEVKTFQDNLLTRVTVLDEKGQGRQLVVYQYTYYD